MKLHLDGIITAQKTKELETILETYFMIYCLKCEVGTY